MFGNSVVSGHNMADILEDFGAQSGKKIVVTSISYNNLGSSGSQSLRHLFKKNSAGDSFVDANGNNTTDPTKFVIDKDLADGVGSKFYQILNAPENTPIDKFYIVTNREIYYSSSNTNSILEPQAAAAFVYMLQKQYPNIEICIVEPPVYELDDFRCTGIVVSGTKKYLYYSSKLGMQKSLDTATTNFKAAIANVCPGVTVDTFSLDDYYLNFGLSEIDLLAKENNTSSTAAFNGQTIHRHPTIAGAYLSAGLFYYDITGECVQNIDVYGRLPQAEAKAIQQEIHRLIGCEKTTHSHTPLSVTLMNGTGDYTVAKDNVKLPEAQWNAMLATIMAYENRGSWMQYDQKTLNRNVNSLGYTYRDYRHSGTDETFDKASPEDATPYNTVFGDCSDWITQIFYETFGDEEFIYARGCSKMYMSFDTRTAANDYPPIANINNLYTWTDDNNFNNLHDEIEDKDGNYRLYLNGTSQGDNYSPADAKTKFLETLQPGDVILYIHYTTPNATRSNGFSEQGGHVMIYLGNGILAHCSGDQAGGGGSDYHVNSKSELWEHSGGIQIDPIDVFIDDQAVRNIFDEAAVCILRPNYSAMTVTENAKNRLDNLVGIVSYKAASVATDSTAAPGDVVEFEFVIKNLTEYTRQVAVEDIIPAGLTYLSGLTYDSSTGKVSSTVKLKPYETVTVKYTVTVDSNASGTIVMDSATIGGVKTAPTSFKVDGVLSEANQTAFVNYVRNSNGSYSKAFDLAAAAYSSMGKTLTGYWSTLEGALGRLYTPRVVSGVQNYIVTSDIAIRAGNLYGGLNVYANMDSVAPDYNDPENHRAKYIGVEDLIAGDIIAFVPQNTARYNDTSLADTTIANDSDCYLYLGEGVFAMYKDGVYTEVSGSEAISLLDSVLGEKVYCVLRPSHLY